MRKAAILFLLICGVHSAFAQNITIGSRQVLHSNYFPPSYFLDKYQKFPVLYILDGDYNFRYVTGLIELQSSISENIPEMIVVGISGKGSPTYLKNCKPNIEGVEDSGNADEVALFIEKELLPYMAKNYKTSNYNILAGHSIGGLFVVNTALQKPKLFNHYIAISPALWWAKNAINKVAKSKMKDDPNFNTDVYISLSDEKGMGVNEFLKLVNSDFKFKHFDSENHNSVGEPTYKWALKSIFKDWKVEKMYFDSASEFGTYHKKVNQTYGQDFNLPNGILSNTVLYILQDKEDELRKMQTMVKKWYPEAFSFYETQLASNYIKEEKYDKAENILTQTLEIYPDSFEIHHKLAELYLAQHKLVEAKNSVEKSIQLAEKQNVRQWQINELIAVKKQTTRE